MSQVHRSAVHHLVLVGPFRTLVTTAQHAIILLRFATSSTTAADWRKWTEVHTPRKTLPG